MEEVGIISRKQLASELISLLNSIGPHVSALESNNTNIQAMLLGCGLKVDPQFGDVPLRLSKSLQNNVGLLQVITGIQTTMLNILEKEI